jgi:hypothetical protein
LILWSEKARVIALSETCFKLAGRGMIKGNAMAMSRVPSILKKIAWGAGILLALVVAAHILLPFAVNTSALRRRIISKAADRLDGEVEFQVLTLALLPLPHVVVTQGRFERHGTFSLRFAKGVVYPRFWPLLTGRVRIDRLKLVGPDIAIPLSTAPLMNRQRSRDHALAEMEQRIQQLLTQAVGRLGPLVVRVEDGRLTLTRGTQTAITFTGIRVKAGVGDDGVALWIRGRSSLVETFEIAGRLAFGGLNGSGRIQFTGLDTDRLQPLGLMPPTMPISASGTDMAMTFEIQGQENLRCQYEIQTPLAVISNGARQLTVRKLSLKGEGRRTDEKLELSLTRLQTGEPGVQLSATATWPAAGAFSWTPAELRLKVVELDVASIRSAALKLAGDAQTVRHIFNIIRGGQIPELDISIAGIGDKTARTGPDVEIRGRLSGGRIVLPHDLLRLEQVGGRVVVEKGRLAAEDVSARLGDSFARGGTLQLGLFDGTRDFSLDTAIDADLSQVPAVLRKVASSRQVAQVLDRIPPVKGRVAGRLRLGDSLDRITVNVSTSGNVNVLDASLNINGSIDVRPSASPDFRWSVQGTLGSRMVAWLYDWGGVPTKFMLTAPITVSQARMTRNRSGAFDAEGRLAISGGLKATAGLQISPGERLSANLRLQDTVSDATLDYRRTRTGGWQAGFAGKLEKSTVDRLLQRNTLVLGWLDGNLRVRYQGGSTQHHGLQGRLDFKQINASDVLPIPLSLQSGRVTGTGAGFLISSVEMKWEDTTARLSGAGTISNEKINLEMDLDTDTLDADKLTRNVHLDNKASGPRPPGRIAGPPIRGTVRVHAGQMLLRGYRIAPLQAVATLADGDISVDLTDAGLCGIAIPGQIRFDPDGVSMLLKPHAVDAALRDTDQCLAGSSITERLEGTVSVDGHLESRGKSGEELIHNLKGGLDVQIADGRVYNVGAAGFFTNLLAFISVNQLIDGTMPDLRRNDFQFKSMTSKLSFQDRIMHIEEGVLKSNAVNIVANGDYGLTEKKLNLVLLISPLTTVDWIIERIPLVGNILQGTLVAIPVGVRGAVADPRVVPLSPAAVGSRLGGILKRTVKTPFRILSPLLKDEDRSSTDQGR